MDARKLSEGGAAKKRIRSTDAGEEEGLGVHGDAGQAPGEVVTVAVVQLEVKHSGAAQDAEAVAQEPKVVLAPEAEDVVAVEATTELAVAEQVVAEPILVELAVAVPPVDLHETRE